MERCIMLKDQIAAFLKEQAVEPDDFKIGTRFAHVWMRMGRLDRSTL